MKFYVGTSGWMYDWNPDGFSWYVKNSGLETVELNMSFYRFPYPNQIKGWLKLTETSNLRWAIKVNRIVTHVYRLSDKSYRYMRRFIALFKPLEEYIDFFLLQLPPIFKATDKGRKRITNFINEFNLGWRLAVEFRDASWFNEEALSLARDLKFTYVSVDSPDYIFYGRSGPYTYIRFHGRTFWYAHYYTDKELYEVAKELLKLDGEAIYAYFNNNHDMLDNARRLRNILGKYISGAR